MLPAAYMEENGVMEDTLAQLKPCNLCTQGSEMFPCLNCNLETAQGCWRPEVNSSLPPERRQQ